MLPTLEDGDFVVMKSNPVKRSLKIGDIVILKRLGEPVMIKRIIDQNADATYQLAGDGVSSVPRINLNSVTKNQIVGITKVAIGKRGLFRLQ